MLGDLGVGQILLANRAYDSDALRDRLAARGAWANVKKGARRRPPKGVRLQPDAWGARVAD